jgi:hypothetical protein
VEASILVVFSSRRKMKRKTCSQNLYWRQIFQKFKFWQPVKPKPTLVRNKTFCQGFHVSKAAANKAALTRPPLSRRNQKLEPVSTNQRRCFFSSPFLNAACMGEDVVDECPGCLEQTLSLPRTRTTAVSGFGQPTAPRAQAPPTY